MIGAALLVALVVRTPWPLANTVPTQDASAAVGVLLLTHYMVGFEGAAFLIIAGIAGAVILGRREGEPAQTRTHDEEGMSMTPATTRYTCPMHPEVQSDQPGECPKCGMNLVPMQTTGQPAATQATSPATVYTCPMHSEVRQSGPGQCPKCGLNLAPADDGMPMGGHP